jgi:hypothetical protein
MVIPIKGLTDIGLNCSEPTVKNHQIAGNP